MLSVDIQPKEDSEKSKESENYTEKNNMLIEQMFRNKERKYSYTNGIERTFKNKLNSKVGSKRKVIKKFINNKPVKINATPAKDISNSSNSAYSSERSQGKIGCTKHAFWFTFLIIEQNGRSEYTKVTSKFKSSKQLEPFNTELSKLNDASSKRDTVVKSKLRSVLESIHPQILENEGEQADEQLSIMNNDNKLTETQQLIAQSIAELDRMREDNDHITEMSNELEDESPKINVQLKDTWGNDIEQGEST